MAIWHWLEIFNAFLVFLFSLEKKEENLENNCSIRTAPIWRRQHKNPRVNPQSDRREKYNQKMFAWLHNEARKARSAKPLFSWFSKETKQGFSRCTTAPRCSFSARCGSERFLFSENRTVRCGAVRFSLFQNHTVRCGFSLERCCCGAVRIIFFNNRTVRRGADMLWTVVSYGAVERESWFKTGTSKP